MLKAIHSGFNRFTGYVSQVFDPNGAASFSRWATGATVGTSCWALVHLVRLNHALPDPLQLGALAAWMTAPYGLNRAMAAFGRHDDAPGPGNPGTASLQSAAATTAATTHRPPVSPGESGEN